MTFLPQKYLPYNNKEDQDSLISRTKFQEILSGLQDLGPFSGNLSAEEILEIGKDYAILARSFFSQDFWDVVNRNPDLIVKDQTVHDDSQNVEKHPTIRRTQWSKNEDLVDLFSLWYETLSTVETLFLQNAKEGVSYGKIPSDSLKETLKRISFRIRQKDAKDSSPPEGCRRKSTDISRHNRNKLGYYLRKNSKRKTKQRARRNPQK